MRSRSLWAAAVAFGGCLALFAGLDPKKPPAPPVEPPAVTFADKPVRVLPGLQADGTVLLPNQWKIRPAGKHLDVGDLPVNLAVHPSGQYLAVLNAGMRGARGRHRRSATSRGRRSSAA